MLELVSSYLTPPESANNAEESNNRDKKSLKKKSNKTRRVNNPFEAYIEDTKSPTRCRLKKSSNSSEENESNSPPRSSLSVKDFKFDLDNNRERNNKASTGIERTSQAYKLIKGRWRLYN